MSDLKRYQVSFQWTLQGARTVSVVAEDRAAARTAAKGFGLRLEDANSREFDFLSVAVEGEEKA